MKRLNYEEYDTKTLIEIWCYNSNKKLTGKIEKILKTRRIKLTAENVQKILE